jgi:Fibronectin type III domain
MRASSRRSRSWIAALLLSAPVALACPGVGVAGAQPALPSLPALSNGPAPSGHGYRTHRGPRGELDVNVCSTAISVGSAHCDAHIRTDSRALSARPSRKGGVSPNVIGNEGAYDPAYLQSAYNVAAAAAADGGGAGQVVAIVDAYDDPYVASNLAYYRSFFGLSSCPSGTVSHSTSGCVFEKVNQNGVAGSYPKGNSSWGVEISLDVEMVSAICPACQILLVEANNSSLTNLGAAVNTAVGLGANVVSNSYGGGEFSSEPTYTADYYNHPGVAITVAAGDSGYGAEYPAASADVTAVGGTSLTQLTNTGTRDGSESVWSGSGAGCSAYEPKPEWQKDTGCLARSISDVSAVADPNTGVWVYDTYGTRGWAIYGGTSVATPIVGAFYALAGNALGSSATPASYAYAAPGALYDVTSGSDGSCSPSYLCTAGTGYDGPTGLGTPGGEPDSMAAFLGTPPPPPTPTAPSTPASLTATAGNAQVALSWSASSGYPTPTYAIERSTTSATEGFTVLISGLTGTSYADTGLTNGTTYYYRVVAQNEAGPSGPSPVASATPVLLTLPGAPALTAETAASRGVKLAWTLLEEQTGGSPIASYELYRATSSGTESAYRSIACTALACTYNDTSTRRRTVYYYEVAAVNGVGTGPRSNQASAVAR